MENSIKNDGSFAAVKVTREDLEEYGIVDDASNISDKDMEAMASEIGKYFEDSFSSALGEAYNAVLGK
jgi:hypothetical protein